MHTRGAARAAFLIEQAAKAYQASKSDLICHNYETGALEYLRGRHLLPELNVVCGRPVPVQLVRALYCCPELPGAGVSVPCKHIKYKAPSFPNIGGCQHMLPSQEYA